MLSKIENIENLIDEYNFDCVYINTKNIEDFDFEFINEELVVDFSGPPNYLGIVKIDTNKPIEVYWNSKIEVNYAELKYKNIKKERKNKIEDILNKKES